MIIPDIWTLEHQEVNGTSIEAVFTLTPVVILTIAMDGDAVASWCVWVDVSVTQGPTQFLNGRPQDTPPVWAMMGD